MRKIPLLGLPISLLLVAFLVVAALPAVVLAVPTPMLGWGTVTLNGDPAPLGTTIEIFVGSDSVASGSEITDRMAGEYGAVDVISDSDNYGQPLTYKVNGLVATATKVMRSCDTSVTPVFGLCNQNVNLVAGGDQTQHTLTVTVSPMGAGTVDTMPAQPSGGYVEGTVVTLTATANSGNTFMSWSGDTDPSVGNVATVTMDSAKMVTASFEVADPDAIIIPLAPGWNVISTPIWLDEDSDQTRDILAEGYEGYRWSGSSWKTLSKSYTWEPLEAFYVKAATATFQPMVSDEKPTVLPNDRKLSSNKWALIGSSPADGVSPMAIDAVLAGLNDNYVNVFIPGSGASCTVGNCDGTNLDAYSGAWVFVGGEKTRTIVGSYFTPVAQ
jgi:hypothetical protein